MKKTFLFSIVLLIALSLCVPFLAFATEGELTLRLESSVELVQPGEEVTVLLFVDQNPGFFQATLQLQYDPAALGFVGSDLQESVLATELVAIDGEEPGAVTVTIHALPVEEDAQAQAHTATGRILAVTFRVMEECTGYLTVTVGGTADGGGNIVTVSDTNVTFVSQLPEPPAVCEHTQREQIPMVRATCTEPGWTEGIKCADCGEVLEAPQYIVPYGHQPSESVPENVIPADCQSDGSYESVVYCSICSIELSRETVAIPTTGEHYYGTEQERTEPSCTEDGHVIMACVCGLTQTEVLPASGHKVITDAAVDATCAESGLTEGSHCETCGEVFQAQEVVDALGHDEKVIPGYAATCESHGLSDGAICDRCGTITVPQTETPLAEHSEELVPGQAATCTKDGWTDGTVCAFCGVTLSAPETIPASGHTEVYVSEVAATCSATGREAGTKCTECNTILSGCQVIAKKPHTEMVLRPVEPTCTTPGKTEGKYCMVCGHVIQAQEEVPPTAHKPQTIPGQEPTCTSTGWTEGSRCAACHEVLEDSQVIPKLPHTGVLLPGHPASCGAAGLTDGEICNICGTIMQSQREIPKLEHTYDHGCDVDCNVCGAARVSLQHSYTPWTVIRQATETSPGEQGRSCTNCGHQETRTLSMLQTTKDDKWGIMLVSYVVMAGCTAVIVIALRKKRAAEKE